MKISAALVPLLCLFAFTEAEVSDLARVPNGNRFGSTLGHSMPMTQDDDDDDDGEDGEDDDALNSFGAAYARAGRRWTAALCKLDSDGDGRSNGEELGDPDCVWTPGSEPARTTGLSNPGVKDQAGSIPDAPVTSPTPSPIPGTSVDNTNPSQPNNGVQTPAQESESGDSSAKILAGMFFAGCVLGAGFYLQKRRKPSSASVPSPPVSFPLPFNEENPAAAHSNGKMPPL